MFKYHLAFLVAGAMLVTDVAGKAEWHVDANGTNYLIDPDARVNWHEAVTSCAARNLSLVTIPSEPLGRVLVAVADGVEFWIDDTYHPSNDYGEERCAYIRGDEFNLVANDCYYQNCGLLCDERNSDLSENTKEIDSGDLLALETQLSGAKFLLMKILRSIWTKNNIAIEIKTKMNIEG